MFLFFALAALALGYLGYLGFKQERANAHAADTGPDVWDRFSTIAHNPDSLIPRSETLH